MSTLSRFAVIAVAVLTVAPIAGHATDDDSLTAPFSGVPTLLDLCGGYGTVAAETACRTKGYGALMTELDKAVRVASATAPANVRPLLMRDQAWFYDMIEAATEDISTRNADADRKTFDDMIRRRLATLVQIGNGFGRPGVLGTWEDAFGSVTVTAAEDGTYRLAIDQRAIYGADDERRWSCQAAALVKMAAGGWLAGTIVVEQPLPPLTTSETKSAGGPLPPPQPQPIKMRRQGETLRIVVGDQKDDRHDGRPSCPYSNQITASYFAAGKPDAVATPGKVDSGFVVPSFDCTHPQTASDEEICADPDLAENDQRLNRAWRALLPRLDGATRRMLTEDQRHWVGAQAAQYREFLHPYWAKTTYFMHFTASARDKLSDLQRERIALLEGFDEKRIGLTGLWLSFTAILEVTPTNDGGLHATGWKWDQGDWKAGCEYDITGKVVNGAFRSDTTRKNPDTLELDHASLVVNRGDDAFAAKRTTSDDSDEQKCKRNPSNSSTARLFPARPSPDINDFDSIR